MSEALDKASKALHEYEATLALVNALSPTLLQNIADTRASLPHMNKVELRSVTHQTRDFIKRYRHEFKIEAPAREVIEIFDHVQKAPDGRLYLLPKYALRKLVGRYERAMPDFHTLPEHADIRA